MPATAGVERELIQARLDLLGAAGAQQAVAKLALSLDAADRPRRTTAVSFREDRYVAWGKRKEVEQLLFFATADLPAPMTILYEFLNLRSAGEIDAGVLAANQTKLRDDVTDVALKVEADDREQGSLALDTFDL